jgi:hypothetical protein
MNDILPVRTRRFAMSDHRDGGSATGVAIGVLSALLVALLVFVALRYTVLKDDDEPAGPISTPDTTATPGDTSTPSSTPTPTVGAFNARWVGAVSGDVSQYTVDVVITDNGTTLSGLVNYAEMPCKGVWTQTARSGNHVEVHEVITEGPRCADEVDITLDMNPDGTIDFAIIYSDEYFPTATLSRDI